MISKWGSADVTYITVGTFKDAHTVLSLKRAGRWANDWMYVKRGFYVGKCVGLKLL